MVPEPIIILLFLAAFILSGWQYVRLDPVRRILNVRFAVMAIATIGATSYPIFSFLHPDDRHAAWLALALSLFCLACGYYLLRRMPPRETD